MFLNQENKILLLFFIKVEMSFNNDNIKYVCKSISFNISYKQKLINSKSIKIDCDIWLNKGYATIRFQKNVRAQPSARSSGLPSYFGRTVDIQ